MILNREDPEQDTLLSSRFEIYNSHIPIPALSSEIISFLSSVQLNPSSIERRQVFKEAIRLKSKDSSISNVDCPIKQIITQIFEFDPNPTDLVSTQEKLVLLRALPKHLGEWEKICKEFKDKPVPAELLKKVWRCLKVTMREEVAEIRKKVPQYHYFKWLRAAVRKLETNTGRKTKHKSITSINPRPKEQRMDMLSVMVEAENAKFSGIQSSTSLNINSSSSFKVYETVGTLQELCN